MFSVRWPLNSFGGFPSANSRSASLVEISESLCPYAPHPLLKANVVHVEHHHASAEVVVRDVDFVGRLVEPNLFDAADNHRGRGRVLLPECRTCRGLRRRISRIAA